jgi:hypothetical protein
MTRQDPDLFNRIVELEQHRLALRSAIVELLAEADSKREGEDHRSGYTLDTYGIQLARQALENT